MGHRSRGRKVALLAAGLAASMAAGCALSPQERQSIIDTSAELAAERAGTLAMVDARRAGVSDGDAEKVGAYARIKARRLAEETARRLIPQAEEGKRSKLGAFFGALAVALVQVLAGAGRRMWA